MRKWLSEDFLSERVPSEEMLSGGVLTEVGPTEELLTKEVLSEGAMSKEVLSESKRVQQQARVSTPRTCTHITTTGITLR